MGQVQRRNATIREFNVKQAIEISGRPWPSGIRIEDEPDPGRAWLMHMRNWQ